MIWLKASKHFILFISSFIWLMIIKSLKPQFRFFRLFNEVCFRTLFCKFFGTRNYWCEFLASDGINLLNAHESFFNTPVSGAFYIGALYVGTRSWSASLIYTLPVLFGVNSSFVFLLYAWISYVLDFRFWLIYCVNDSFPIIIYMHSNYLSSNYA